MKELSAYDIKDPKAKSALLDCFVKRVEIGTEGNITVEYDLFGYETGFTMGSEAFKEVGKSCIPPPNRSICLMFKRIKLFLMLS